MLKNILSQNINLASQRKHFEHNLLEKTELEAVVEDGRRYYTTPTGERLPSVTTILSEAISKKELEKWRNRVGEKEADKITKKAARRGNAVHDICEKYILNDENFLSGQMPNNIDNFMDIKPIIDERIGVIYGVEYPLYSHTLKTAGRVDLIADFDGEPSIIDFKTSKKIKTEDKILSYFLQETCYSIMLQELIGFKAKKIVTIMHVDHEKPLVFVKNRKDYIDQVVDIFVKQRKTNA